MTSTPGRWSTPKKVHQMECPEQFVALTPEDKTFLEAGNDADELIERHFDQNKRFNTKAHDGIFRSLGISDKLKSIHTETDEVVKNMMAVPHSKELFQNDRRKQHSASPYQGSYGSSLTPIQASRCQDLFLAKDDIIEQKDIIMQKQKNIIMQLRDRNAALEEQLLRKEHSNIQAIDYERFYQDHSLQIQTLKQEMNEAYSKKCTEIEKLQRKLGEKEYELGKLNILMKENNLTKQNMMEKLKKEFEANNQNLNEEKERNTSIATQMKTLRQENQKLHSYLEELPTSDEFRKLKQEVKLVTQERDDAVENKDVIVKKYKDLKAEYVQKELDMKKMNRCVFGLKDEVACLTATLEKYRTKAPVTIEEHDSKLLEISMLQKENNELRESLGKRQKKMAKLYYDSVAKQKQYEAEKAVLNENNSQLQEELKEKCIAITKVNATNQDILANNFQVQSELKKYKERYNPEYEIILSTFNAEILNCSDELRSFVELCKSMSRGEEPNLQTLLGLKDSPEKTKESALSDVESLKRRIGMIQDIRKEIDILRQTAAEKHAEELGKNMCVTQ